MNVRVSRPIHPSYPTYRDMLRDRTRTEIVVHRVAERVTMFTKGILLAPWRNAIKLLVAGRDADHGGLVHLRGVVSDLLGGHDMSGTAMF